MRLAVITAALVILTSFSTAAHQQAATAGQLRFASASVERSEPVQQFTLGGEDLVPFVRDVRVGPGDRFEANTSLRRLIEYAYGFDQHWDRSHGTDRRLDQLFYVSAQGPAGSFGAATADELPAVRHMLQQLLADRFNVAISVETETRSAMVLRRALPDRFGPNLRRVPGGCRDGSQADADASGLARCVWNQQGSKFKVVVSDFDRVATWISRTGRLDVVNETGLIGAFAFETSFDPYTINRRPPVVTVDSTLDPALTRAVFAAGHYQFEPSFEVAMKNDLGLVISYEPRPAQVLVITHVESLREN